MSTHVDKLTSEMHKLDKKLDSLLWEYVEAYLAMRRETVTQSDTAHATGVYEVLRDKMQKLYFNQSRETAILLMDDEQRIHTLLRMYHNLGQVIKAEITMAEKLYVKAGGCAMSKKHNNTGKRNGMPKCTPQLNLFYKTGQEDIALGWLSTQQPYTNTKVSA